MKGFINRQWQRLQTYLPIIGIIILLGWLGLLMMTYAPEIKRLDYVEVQADPKGITLGWQELGQKPGTNSAEKEHIKITALTDVSNSNEVEWQLQNVSSKRRVDAKTTQIDTRFLRRFALQSNDLLHFNEFTIKVLEADNKHLKLENLETKQIAEWTGTKLIVDGKAGYSGCERSDSIRRFFGAISDLIDWHKRSFSPQKDLRLFSIGGQVHCTTRWKHTELPPDSIRIHWHMGQFWVGNGSEPSRVVIERDGQKQDLKHMPLAVNGNDGRITRVILGRTHYEVAYNDTSLTLKPINNQPVFKVINPEDIKDETEKATELQKQKTQEEYLRSLELKGITPVYTQSPWIGEVLVADPFRKIAMILLLTFSVTSVFFTLIFSNIKERMEGKSNPLSHALMTIGTMLFAWLAVAWKGELSAALWILWLSVIWTSLMLIVNGRMNKATGRLWALALLLAGIGVLTLAQLAAGADNTRWLRFATENLFYLTWMSTFIAAMALIPRQFLQNFWIALLLPHNSSTRRLRWIYWSKIIVLGFVLFILLAQFAIGTEQGIFGIQPVEIAKFMIILLAATALWQMREIRIRSPRYYLQNPLWVVWLFFKLLIGFTVVSLVIAVGVHDYSPTLIISALMLAYGWLLLPHPTNTNIRRRRLFWGLRIIFVLLPIAAFIALGFWYYNNPPGYDSNIWQAERLRIWANPEQYPEAASQLLTSLSRVAHGGWFGSGWFGVNGLSMQIPAVQDDFIGSFLLHRFGGIIGLLLVIIQILWLSLLFRLSNKLTQVKATYNRQTAMGILGYTLFGLAWIHLLHWMISWSNVLGFLPIMGQPMTWLSSGNSHLLSIGGMTLVLALLGTWLLEENQPLTKKRRTTHRG